MVGSAGASGIKEMGKIAVHTTGLTSWCSINTMWKPKIMITSDSAGRDPIVYLVSTLDSDLNFAYHGSDSVVESV